MTKQEIRQEIKSLKKRFEGDLSSLSSIIRQHLESSLRFKKAKTVLLYHALADEPETSQILQQWHKTKRILLPVVVGDELELRIYDSSTSLQQGAFGIKEPSGKAFANLEEIDLAIIPGIAFTKNGKRLGRGKGFYDKLLPRLQHTYKIGVCFPFQILDDIPTEEHDVLMDEVLSI